MRTCSQAGHPKPSLPTPQPLWEWSVESCHMTSNKTVNRVLWLQDLGSEMQGMYRHVPPVFVSGLSRVCIFWRDRRGLCLLGPALVVCNLGGGLEGGLHPLRVH